MFKDKDDELMKGNHRPVTVLPMLSNMFGTIKNDQLFGYFIEKFREFLSVFRKRYNC